MDTAENLDLQRILRTLRQADSHTPKLHIAGQSYDSHIPGLGLLGPSRPYDQSVTPHREFQSAARVTPSQHLDSPQTTATPLIPDASSIVSWPAALKHLTKYISTNERLAAKIKHMIEEQRKHEQQWWASRDALIEKQSSRSQRYQEAANLMRSLGGVASETAPTSTPASEMAELRAFDEGVHKAQSQMAAHFDQQLRSMGVPFFAIKHELVLLEKGPEWPGVGSRISRGELKELQKKMLETLVDLFTD